MRLKVQSWNLQYNICRIPEAIGGSLKAMGAIHGVVQWHRSEELMGNERIWLDQIVMIGIPATLSVSNQVVNENKQISRIQILLLLMEVKTLTSLVYFRLCPLLEIYLQWGSLVYHSSTSLKTININIHLCLYIINLQNN